MAGKPSGKTTSCPGTADQSDLEELLGYNLKRAYMIVREDFRQSLGKDGLRPREFSALSLVVQNPQITQSELARRLGIERSGLVAIVDELEQRGYVTRTMVPGDRRVQALVPKPKGKRAYAELIDLVRQHELALLADFSSSDISTLLALLKKFRRKAERV